jgi:hypothetical protein
MDRTQDSSPVIKINNLIWKNNLATETTELTENTKPLDFGVEEDVTDVISVISEAN